MRLLEQALWLDQLDFKHPLAGGQGPQGPRSIFNFLYAHIPFEPCRATRQNLAR